MGSEWLDSECKNAHFQAFPQSTPSGKFELICCMFTFTPPAAHTLARMALTLSHAHRLYSFYPKRVPIDSSRAKEFNGVFIILQKWPRKNSGGVSQKVEPPLNHPPPPPSSDGSHAYTNRQLLIPGFRIYSFKQGGQGCSKSCAFCSLLQ